MEGLLLEQVDRALEEVSTPAFLAVLVATSDVLPDQYVTVGIFDAGMRLCTSTDSRREATKIW